MHPSQLAVIAAFCVYLHSRLLCRTHVGMVTH